METKNNSKRLSKFVSDYVVYDLETTGMSTGYDEVIEISAVKVTGNVVVDEFTALVNPGRPIPYGATAVNNITNDMVRNCPGFETVLAEFLDFVGDMVLVGHNIHSFDMKFLYRDAQRFLGRTVDNYYVDTLYLSKHILPELAHHRLVDLAVHYNISSEGAHRALNDCRMNQKVYELMAKESPLEHNIRHCPKCNQLLKKRNGRFGEFWGCTAYPACKYTESC